MRFLCPCISYTARPVLILLALVLSSAFAACGASPPAAQRQAAIYVIGGSASGLSLVALGASDGALLWQTIIPQDAEFAVSSVTVTPLRVYVVSGGKPSSAGWSVMALRASDGKVAWSFAAGSLIEGLQVLGDTVYLGSLYSGGVQALRASDGHLRWQHAGNVEALTLAGDTLYTAFKGIAAGSDAVVALQASDGAVRWQDQISGGPWQVLVDQATLYVTTSSDVVALQTSDGVQRWRSPTARGSFRSLVGVAAGNVYLSQLNQNAGILTALRASDGAVLWQHAIDSTPIMTEAAVYVSLAADSLCALLPSDGGTIWCDQAKRAAALAATDRAAYVSDAAGTLCALQAGDGSRRWCQLHLAASSLIVAADRLVLTTSAGAVCTLQTANGKPVWCHRVAASVFDLTLGS
jgi:outer membrane protein assembly factor BamB